MGHIKKNNPIEREKVIVSKMIEIYCRNKHKSEEILCDECEDIKKYSISKVTNCRYAINKPVCKNCNTHCYNPVMRDRIVKVMRYSGPRMLFYHPMDTFYYMIRKYKADK